MCRAPACRSRRARRRARPTDGDRVRRQQHRAEQRLLGLEVVRRDPAGTAPRPSFRALNHAADTLADSSCGLPEDGPGTFPPVLWIVARPLWMGADGQPSANGARAIRPKPPLDARLSGRRQALTTSTVIGNCTSLCSFTGTWWLPTTLAFTPYGSDPAKLAERARAQRHEILLQIPMEPFDYPDNDPGPQTLLTTLGAGAESRPAVLASQPFPGLCRHRQFHGRALRRRRRCDAADHPRSRQARARLSR